MWFKTSLLGALIQLGLRINFSSGFLATQSKKGSTASGMVVLVPTRGVAYTVRREIPSQPKLLVFNFEFLLSESVDGIPLLKNSILE